MIEQTQQKLFEIARDILDLEDQLDHRDDPRQQGELLGALDSLKEHTRSLYDALVVLRHEISFADKSHEEAFSDDFSPEHDPPIFEPSTEKIKDIVAQMPAETQQVDELFKGITDGSPEAHEALSHYQEDIEFEAVIRETEDEPAPDLNSKIQKPRSINDQWGQFSVGLNDRTAFVQHLFLGDNEGFNRVLSQINTFETLEEVSDFLEQHVKPEYNNWETKDAVVDRLMRLLQQRFKA